MIRDTLPVDAGDVRLAAYVSGPRDAPPIVLVHGYPDSAAVWEPVRVQLESRYRVISYDVRGAGASEAPAARDEYRIERLAADLCAVVNATCGQQPFHLVGHDWGSIQSWEAVTDPQFKGRIRSFTSISGPCLDYASVALRGTRDPHKKPRMAKQSPRFSIRQLLRSWYIFFFLLPWLPELVWRMGGVRLWPLWLRITERVDASRDPTQMRNAINGLNLYRANFIDKLLHPRARHVHVPVQFIVPLHDRYVGLELSVGQEAWLGPHDRVELDAGHWVVLREPQLVATHIEGFVARHLAEPGGPVASSFNARAAGE
ncbi:alpha/beta fold hydrolase [Paraburkholderia strydomiana]|uniref:alpha/beta fold hydrolase n=1 Tax=Paraburkholderia strydomiana TaxID=1245417 RepID=UPI0038BB1AB9